MAESEQAMHCESEEKPMEKLRASAERGSAVLMDIAEPGGVEDIADHISPSNKIPEVAGTERGTEEEEKGDREREREQMDTQSPEPCSAPPLLGGLDGAGGVEDEVEGAPVIAAEDDEEEEVLQAPPTSPSPSQPDRQADAKPDSLDTQLESTDSQSSTVSTESVSVETELPPAEVETTPGGAELACVAGAPSKEDRRSPNRQTPPSLLQCITETPRGTDASQSSTVLDRERLQEREPVVTRRPDSQYREPVSVPREAETGDSGASFPPELHIKDEPLDDEYDRALAPSHAPAPPHVPVTNNTLTTPHSQAPLHPLLDKVKDEPDNAQEFGEQPKTAEELKISAVFSVGGHTAASAAPPQYPPVSRPVPGVGGALGAPVRPRLLAVPANTQAPPPSSSSSPSSLPPPPAASASPAIRVSCSGCKKVLQKGQTAYQRKGSTQLFCSTLCLTGYTVPAVRTVLRKTCHYCLKEIGNPKDVIIAPVDTVGTVKDFCSQSCLSAFDYKRKTAASTLSTEGVTIKCSMCQRTAIIRHEVNYQGVVHKLCSDSCFSRFRSVNNLTMNCCENCGGYCYSGGGQCHVLQIEGTAKKFCSPTCITAYKLSAKVTPCTVCQSLRSSAEMLENTSPQGRTELFCSVNCLSAYRVQNFTTSGVPVPCNSCKASAVPQYHLAMSDGSIRNFCSYNCVVSFQTVFNKPSSQPAPVPLSQSQVITSTTSSVPGGAAVNLATPAPPSTAPPAPVQPAEPPRAPAPAPVAPPSTPNRCVVKLRCRHCRNLFTSKPELLEFKGRMVQFCGSACVEEFRKVSFVSARCEYCKIEKVVKETIKFNRQDRSFCSEGCKLLYKHDLAKRWGSLCRSCAYCSNAGQKAVQNHFAGRLEEFCSEECMSLYTVLFYQMAKCDWCKRQGKLLESVKWHGEMKHFCNLSCLLQYCGQQISTETLSSTVNAMTTMPAVAPTLAAPPCAPVAAPVIPSLSPVTQKKEPTPVIANVVSLASAPAGQPALHASTALQGAVPTAQAKIIGDASTQTDALKLPPVAPPRILKNKALLCKPISLTKATSCKPHTQSKESQTEEEWRPDVLVIPVPVPVFIPVPMHLYTQYTPYPLGLPLPVPVPLFLPTSLDKAEQALGAVQDLAQDLPSDPYEADLLHMAELIAEEQEKDKPVSHGDQGSTYSGDLESEAVSTPHSWEDDVNHCPLRSGHAPEPDPPTTPGLQPPPSPSLLQDLEADFPIADAVLSLAESFDPAARETGVTLRHRTRRRPRDGFPPRKRGRKRAGAVVSAGLSRSAQPPGAEARHALKHMYGVNAWRSWVQWRNAQPDTEQPRFGSRPMSPKEDVLACSSAELSYGLCRFIRELRRPNGEHYTPDSIFYLCLGIQQHLFENGRIENIFTDVFYSRFTLEITKMLKDWKPTVLPSGYLHSRVEEEYLWECKQLGAYSPIVLLNTLLFFNTKLFQLKTIPQHLRLSFAHVMRCTRTAPANTPGNTPGIAKTTCLRFFPPAAKREPAEKGAALGKRRLEEGLEEEVMEMPENTDNPLRCPVRLYEFYLSKCSDSVKQRTDVFYLQPERSCVPNSPLWYSGLPLDPATLETMLTRILMVREVHEQLEKAPPHDDEAAG
ncbi:zinc finger MYM-type protein 4 isoform X2 [Amia ocellicauda]|uniref:zinc finger MYM-type protein 4 isoform X2 n=1 Tax=Amia ocellicauda TaxID=2972642 RepID=UPI003464D2E8